MLIEVVRSPIVRWSLALAVVIGLASAVWINRLASYDVAASNSAFREEHPVFRTRKPVIGSAAGHEPAHRADTESRSESSAAEGSEDWPALFGPTFNSVSPSEQIRTEWPGAGPAERWRRDIGRGYTAPVIRKGRVVVFYRQGDEEIVEALEAQTGKLLWDFHYPTTYQINVHFSDGPYSTPATDEENVYAWSAQGTLRCLTLAEGRVVWQRDTTTDFAAVANQFPVASSPVLEAGKVILNVGGKEQQAGIVALDAKTGQTLWTATDHLASYATPVVATMHGQRYLFVFTQTGLVALNPDDGHVFWTIDYRSMNHEFVNTTTPLVVGNYVVLSGWALGGLCIEVLPDGSYAERWRDRRGLDSQFVNLVSDGQNVYGCSAREGTYRCIELKTGKVRWAWSNDLIGRGAYSILVGRRALLFGEPGQLASLELGDDEPVLRSITDEGLLAAPCYTMPALANGLIYLRNESTLRCLDLTLEQ